MNTIKKAGLITVVIAITLVALILTLTFLPGYIKGRGNLYEAWEKGQWHLTNDDYDELIIEYDYVRNYRPNYTAIQTFDDMLRNHTEKENIEHRIGDEISFPDTKPVYDQHDLSYLEDKYRDAEKKENTVVIYVLYLDGLWKEGNVLGLSYRGTNIIIFKETIMRSADRSPGLEYGDIEKAVLIHEWGHLIGLVGRDYDSDHESEEYKHHCNLEAGDCVMAASVEINVTGMGRTPPTEFCELCLEDIERIRTMNDPFSIANLLTYTAMIGQFAVGTTWVITIANRDDKKQEYYGYENAYYKETDHVKENDEKKYY